MAHTVLSCIGERVCLAFAFPSTGGRVLIFEKRVCSAMERLRWKWGRGVWGSSSVACGCVPHSVKHVGDSSPSILERSLD